MIAADSRALMLALRAWLDEDDGNARRVAEYVYERALACHFGYFRLLWDMVDGKIRPTAEDEMTGEADCLVVVSEDGKDVGIARAA
jgi:hypothetical protein